MMNDAQAGEIGEQHVLIVDLFDLLMRIGENVRAQLHGARVRSAIARMGAVLSQKLYIFYQLT